MFFVDKPEQGLKVVLMRLWEPRAPARVASYCLLLHPMVYWLFIYSSGYTL